MALQHLKKCFGDKRPQKLVILNIRRTIALTCTYYVSMCCCTQTRPHIL